MTTPSLAAAQALVASASSPSIAPGGTSDGSSGLLGQINQAASQTAAQTEPGSGWLYHLLTKLGVSPDTASTVTDLVVRPLSILIVVLVAALIARYGAKVIRRMMMRVADKTSNRSGSPRAGARVTTMAGLVANIWRLFIFVVAGAIVLGMLGINLTPLLASATIIGATLGFGAQQIVRDYFSGALMTMEDQYNIGDSVTVGGVTGVIEDVSLRLTRFRGVDGTMYVIPNGDIRLIGNLSRGWARAVVDLTLPGAVAAALGRVRSVISDAAHEVGAAAGVRRPHDRAAQHRRPVRGGCGDDHDARHAAHGAVPARPAHPGAARGDARRVGQGGPVAGRPGGGVGAGGPVRAVRRLTPGP